MQRYRSELGEGWVTTVKQTVVDLAARPDWGMPQVAVAAVAALLPRIDPELLGGAGG